MPNPRLAMVVTALFLATQPALADPPATAEVAIDKAEVLEHKAAEQQPAPRSEIITKAEAKAVDPAGENPVDDALTCLSRTIYWEAKGAADADMAAVANVVLNRVGHEGFADTICGVVKDGSQKPPCQFSWWCDGRADQVQEDAQYSMATEIARKALNQQLPDGTGGAMYFHDRRVRPAWAGEYVRTAQTGKFMFYKPRAGKAR
jgi:spore germination cell wall hydrolase CwlJ-like protein